MKLIGITWPGLTTIALLVATLWGCVLAENAIRKQAQTETYRVLQDLRFRKMRRQVQPVSTPMPLHRPRTSLAG